MDFKDSRIVGASNVNPCPECGFPWFAVIKAEKLAWTVVCRNCNTEYIKPIKDPGYGNPPAHIRGGAKG